MREIHVVDQAGAVGYVSPSDKRGFELNPLAWTAMNNVRMDEGAVEPAWGYDGGAVSLSDTTHTLNFMTNLTSSENYYIVADDTDIYAIWVDTNTGVLSKKAIGNGPGDVPAGSAPYTGFYDTAGDTWVTTSKDGHLILTNGKNLPQVVLRDDVVDLEAVDLPGFGDDPVIAGQAAYSNCKTIISFSGFLVAGNIGFKDNTDKPDMVAWSDRSDTGSIPPTWDYTDPATLAGNTALPSNYGAVVAMQEVRDELMIYCERGAYRMQFTGGQYVFRIVPAFDTVGALGPRSVCSSKGANIIVSHTDVVRSDGQYPVSIANGTIRKELFEQLSPGNAHKVQVVEYAAKSEILIICPDKQDDVWCGKVFAWSWITETWAVRHGLLMRCLASVPKLVSSLDPENWTALSSYDEIYRWGHVPPITDGVTTPPLEEQLQLIGPPPFSGNWDYVTPSSLAFPESGQIVQADSSIDTLIINRTDDDGTDRTADLETLQVESTITGAGKVWTIDTIDIEGTHVIVTVTPAEQGTDGVQNFDFATPVSYQILSSPENGPRDQYDLMTATFGTLLADEGVLYMYGIGTLADEFFPSQPIDDVSNSLWQFDYEQLSYTENPRVYNAPSVERRGINLTNDESVQIVTAVYPKMEGGGSINIHVGAVDFIGGRPADIRWDKPVLFNPETDYRITCRVAGRRHAIKFEAVAENDENGVTMKKYQNFRLAAYDLEFSQMGRR